MRKIIRNSKAKWTTFRCQGVNHYVHYSNCSNHLGPPLTQQTSFVHPLIKLSAYLTDIYLSARWLIITHTHLLPLPITTPFSPLAQMKKAERITSCILFLICFVQTQWLVHCRFLINVYTNEWVTEMKLKGVHREVRHQRKKGLCK